MDEHLAAVLPYRTDPDDLHRFLVARTRGRPLSQVRTQNFAPKNFEGTLAAVDALALVEDKAGDLSALGRRYAVSNPAERAGLLREILGSFPPYALLLEAILAGDTREPTPLEWIETWWASHRFGSSESNRAEATPVFAKLVEAAGLGTYIQGRKGHVSRIEWTADATARLHTPSAEPEPLEEVGRPALALSPTTSVVTSAADSHADREPERFRPRENLLTWQLSPGREVTLRLPADVTEAERTRLLRLFELLLQP
jgi:hypothetical protein